MSAYRRDDLVDDDATDERGAIAFAEQATPSNYGLIDEITARVIATGDRVIGIRKADIPRGEALAAILCYPV